MTTIEKTKPILGVSSGREAKITTQKSPSNPPLKSILKKENAKDEFLFKKFWNFYKKKLKN